MIRRQFAIAILAAFSLATVGCATIENPWFQMSSDSPMPWFGGEVKLPGPR